MKPKWILPAAAAFSAIVLSTALARAAATLIINSVGGTVRIHQGVPCGEPVDLTATIEKGRIEVTPLMIGRLGGGLLGNMLFDLHRLDVFLTPFSVQRTCRGIHATAEFYEIGLQLAGVVRFMGEETGGSDSMQFRFRIPKEEFLVYESVLDNLPVPQPEAIYKHPSEDVIGLIDLRRKSVQLHIVLMSRLHFRAGCVGDRCRIDEIHEGMQTADILGVTILDETLPTVSCTPIKPPGNAFQVLADDDSDMVIIHLGDFTLRNGEVFQLVETGRQGVTQLPANRPGGTRFFQANKGFGFVEASDPAGNVATAYCR